MSLPLNSIVCVPILRSIATYIHSRALVPCSNADSTNSTIHSKMHNYGKWGKWG